MLKEILKHITPFDSETLDVLANLFSEEQMSKEKYLPKKANTPKRWRL